MEEVRPGALASISRSFHEERSFWLLLSPILFCVAFLKGFTFPIRWAATQAQIDYSQGFTKRGLFGAFVTRPLHLEHYVRFAWFSTLLLVLFYGFVFLFAKESGLLARFREPVVLAVFCASFGVTYLTHLSGYFDIPLAILTIPVLLVRSTLPRFLVAIPVTITALLLHEVFLVVFFPLILLTYLLQCRSEASVQPRRSPVAALVVLASTAVTLTILLSWHSALSPAAVVRLQAGIASRTDFRIYPLVFIMLRTSTGENFHRMLAFLHDPWWQAQFWTGLLAFGPTILFLATQIAALVRRAVRQRRREVTVYAVLCMLAPLTLNVIAWDICRWLALAVLTGFLSLCVLSRFLPAASVPGSPVIARCGILLIALNMASMGVLIDGSQARGFPFVTSGLRELLSFHPTVPQ